MSWSRSRRRARNSSCHTSFGELVDSEDALRSAIVAFTDRAAEKLRRQGSVAAALGVFLQANPFRRDESQYAPSSTLPLTHPSQDSRRLIAAAVA